MSTTLEITQTNANITLEVALGVPSQALGTMASQDADAVAITGGSITNITDLSLEDGGTGASTAEDARTNLGLGSIATQDADDVEITGGSIENVSMNNITVGDGVTNYAEFEDDTGFLVNHGSALAWTDIDFPIIICTTGAGIPTLAAIRGNVTAPQWEIDDVNVCEGQELIHAWAEGTDLHWHIHVVSNGVDVTNRYLRFEIEWVYAIPGAEVSATITTTSSDLLIPANTPDRHHFIFPIATVSIPNGKIGTHIWARLKRVAAVGTAPTLNPFCSMLQMHIQVNTFGSRQISTK